MDGTPTFLPLKQGKQQASMQIQPLERLMSGMGALGNEAPLSVA